MDTGETPVTRRASRRLAAVVAAVAVVALVAGGIAANVALLEADQSDGLGRLSPIATRDAGGAVPPAAGTPARPATVRAAPAPAPADDHGGRRRGDDGERHGDDDDD